MTQFGGPPDEGLQCLQAECERFGFLHAHQQATSQVSAT